MLTKPGMLIIGLGAVWILATGSGFFLLGAYGDRPGSPGTTPSQWPSGSSIRLDPSKLTLLIFLHPRCPCSRASVAELAAIEARTQGRAEVQAILYRPRTFLKKDRADATEAEAAAIPRLRLVDDPDGLESLIFGVETSGHVLLYEPGGRLLFSGGITPSRGQQGANPGSEAVVTLINESVPVSASPREPVYGCPVVNPLPRSGRNITP